MKGASFVDEQWGDGFAASRRQGRRRERRPDVAAKFVDFNTLTVAVDAAKIDALGGDVDFAGDAFVEVVATSDGNTYATEQAHEGAVVPHEARRRTSTGVVDGVIFVNDQIEIDGDGFLLGGDEGTTFARVTGCYKLDTGEHVHERHDARHPARCLDEDPLSREHGDVSVLAEDRRHQARARSRGKVTVVNKQASSTDAAPSTPIDVDYTVVTSQVFSRRPARGEPRPVRVRPRRRLRRRRGRRARPSSSSPARSTRPA